MEDEEAAGVLRKLQESIDSNPDDPGPHFNLGLFLWEKGQETKEIREKAAEHFLISAKLNPHNGTAFRYLGHYYSRVSSDNQRALKCYQRAITLSPDDSESGEALCDLLDAAGKESLEVAVCREASEKSPRAFWAFRILGYLQVHQKKWSEAVPNLQHAIRGYPSCADLWEALGLAYQRLGMYTAAIKSYGRAIELEGSRVFALIESGNIHLILGSFAKGIEQFQQALQISPQNVSAQYGLASALLSLSKECMISGAFMWGASLLEEASNIAKASTCLAGNISCIWKLHGDIQVAYAKCLPWMEKDFGSDPEALKTSILSWKAACKSAALSACSSYQRALHLAPWQANIYVDIAIASDLVSSFKECSRGDPVAWQLPEKMSLGGLLLEGDNNEFWVALGCLSCRSALKQHAFIRGLQIDISLATAWAYLGKFYREEGDTRLAIESFDRARSIDPSLALPWAGMAADFYSRELTSEEAYESCLRAVQSLPLAEFQIGLAKLAMLSGQLSSPQVFGAIQQAIQRAPHFPESHNLRGLVYEAQHDYWSAIISYRLARCTISISADEVSESYFRDVSINLARSLCKAGNALDAVNECEELIKEGLLDLEGLQIYALSLWQLGRTDVLLYVIKDLVASTITTQGTSKEAPVSLICRLLYYISGLEAAVSSILKMPIELFESSKVSFVVSAIHSLDRCNQLESVVSRSRRSLLSHEEITRMHFLIALSKLVKLGSKDCLAIQSGVQHLRKVIHMYPDNDSIRNLLGYLQLSGEAGRDTRIASRCVIIPPSGHSKEEGLISSEQIFGASVVACYTTANCKKRFTFPTCECQLHETKVIKQLQRLLHQEPWNNNVRCLLIVNYLQKAREERFPRHLCELLVRLVNVGLSNRSCSNIVDRSWQYQRFQLLLCASEISLLGQDIIGCVNHAKNASRLIVSDNYLFFAHLQLCRAYAAESNFSSLHQEYTRCLELKTDYPIGWICLKFIESLYELQTGSNQLQLCFEASLNDLKESSHMWKGLFSMVHGLVSIWTKDFVTAEEFLARACSLAGAESCLFLCHGVICMELARQLCDSQFVSRAIRSFKKAKETSIVPLPLVSLLLGQAEASLGSKEKWVKNLRIEWYSWPQEMRPAELYLQMHLLSLQPKDPSDTSFKVELCLSPRNWILRAIHLNPSCSRYWKVLDKFLNE